jgi:hypothetical protein
MKTESDTLCVAKDWKESGTLASRDRALPKNPGLQKKLLKPYLKKR